MLVRRRTPTAARPRAVTACARRPATRASRSTTCTATAATARKTSTTGASFSGLVPPVSRMRCADPPCSSLRPFCSGGTGQKCNVPGASSSACKDSKCYATQCSFGFTLANGQCTAVDTTSDRASTFPTCSLERPTDDVFLLQRPTAGASALRARLLRWAPPASAKTRSA